MNAERCLLAGEALGLGYAALEKTAKYAKDRVVFGRPIGQNQGIQHPLAAAYMSLEAAKLATYHAARVYDTGSKDPSVTPHAVGVACNSAKYLAAEAAFNACERSVSESLADTNMTFSSPKKSFRQDLEGPVAKMLRYSLTAVWGTPKNTMWKGI